MPEAADEQVMAGAVKVVAVAPVTNAVRAIDRIRQARVNGLRAIDVPEWGMKLWFGGLVMADVLAAEDRKPATELDRTLVLIVSKACNEDGSPAFTFGDLEYLKREADYRVLMRVAGFMYGNSGLTKAGADKAVGETADSASA